MRGGGVWGVAAGLLLVGACAGAPSREAARSMEGAHIEPAQPSGTPGARGRAPTAIVPVRRTDGEWRRRLAPEVYRITRQQGTERAFTGKYWNHQGSGVYRCAACGLSLFHSGDKYASGSGWPSYTRPFHRRHVLERRDARHGMVRVEAVCARCGAHLGHVFPDGPAPTGRRFCVNSAALRFEAASTSRR